MQNTIIINNSQNKEYKKTLQDMQNSMEVSKQISDENYQKNLESMLNQREIQRSINFRKAQKLNEQLWK